MTSGISRSIAASLDALAPVLTEYGEALGIPVRLEVPRGRVARPRGRRGWTLHPFAPPGRAVLDLSLQAGRSLLLSLTGLGPATLEARLRRLHQATDWEGLQAPALWPVMDVGHGEASGSPGEVLEGELRRREERLRASGRQMRDLECRLSELAEQQAAPEALGRDFDRIVTLPGVQVFTEPIAVEYGFRRYRLGRFRLDLHFDGRLFLRNLTNRFETYDHPHIESGRPCLGNIQEWIQRLLAQREFAAATEVLLQYLRTVNPADWRKAVTHWEEATE